MRVTTQDLARAFALAMANPAVRAGVRDAMRASIWTEHKLVLHKYVRTQTGQRLVAAAARATDVKPSAIRKMITALPPMDFYVPFDHHRLTWKATPDLAVGWTLNVDNPHIQAFTPAGEPVFYDASQGVPKRALFVLQPAEQKSPRIDPQPAGLGLVIQEPSDGELSGSIVNVMPSGDTIITYLASLVNGAPRQSSRQTTATSTGTVTTSSTSINTYWEEYFMVYFGDGSGDSEVEWTVKYYNGPCSGTADDSNTVRYENIEANDSIEYVHDDLLIGAAPTTSSECMTVELVETDAFQDDYKGNTNVYDEDENVVLYTRNTNDDATAEFKVDYHQPDTDDGGDDGAGGCPGGICKEGIEAQ